MWACVVLVQAELLLTLEEVAKGATKVSKAIRSLDGRMHELSGAVTRPQQQHDAG
jgi:hypothetical protein